jgi:hypothetical protein
VQVYAITEGLPLQPLRHWFFHSAQKQPYISAALDTSYTELAHEKRRWLNEWAEALGAEVTETRDYDSRVKLRAACLVGGVPVSIETDVDHRCTCTGQCQGDVL